MGSFKSMAARLWLAQIFISLVATAPWTETTQLISARQDANGADPVPYPPDFQPNQCSKASTNGWEEVAYSTFGNDNKTNSSPAADTAANDNQANTTPGTDTETTDYTPITRRQVQDGGTSQCSMVAWLKFAQAKDVIRTKSEKLDKFKKYFFSWQADGLMKITLWTMKKGGNWQRTTLDKGTNLKGSLSLEQYLQDVDSITFEASLQPNDHGGVTGEVALFKINLEPAAATA